MSREIGSDCLKYRSNRLSPFEPTIFPGSLGRKSLCREGAGGQDDT